MNLLVFILFSFILQGICLIVGGKASKKIATQDDYFLAGRGITFYPLLMTFVATQVGGGLVLGSAEEAYLYGWSVLFYPLGAALGLLVLGLGVGKKLAAFKVSTVAQIFEVFYNSPSLKKVASLLSILTLFMIFVAQIVGSAKFMTSLGMDSKLWFVVFWSIIILYTAVGGLKGVVATDIIQALFFMGVFIFSFIYVFSTSQLTSYEAFQTGVSNDFAFDLSKLYGWLFMPLLFMVIEQDMGQRCFAAESGSTIKKATLCAAGITLLIGTIPVFFGVLARNLGIEQIEGTSILMTALMKVSNPFLTALVGAAILAAIISTADSLINAIGSNIAQDFGMTGEKNVRTSQCSSALISIAGLLVSFAFTNIVDILILSYELSVSAIFVPIVMALFTNQRNKFAALLAILFGTGGFIFFKIFSTEYPKELITVALSFGGFFVGTLVTKEQTNLLPTT